MTNEFFTGAEEVAALIPDFSPAAEEVGANCPLTGNCDFSCVDSFPLSMAYVPMQKYEKLYEVDKALCQGTLFRALDLPFEGYKRKGGGVR